MSSLLDRFLRYVRIDTQSDDASDTAPSTAKQLTLSRMLADECRAMGLKDVTLNEYGIVQATIPATVYHDTPIIAFNSHVDTSPEYSSENVQPVVHENYSGDDLTLPGDPTKVLRPSEFPELSTCVEHTLITTDGTTLLGADDKAGVAIIMQTAAYLTAHPEIPHGPIRVLFTVDEEIGRGIKGLDFKALDADCAYTLDGGGHGGIDTETFSADMATVTVHGINTHPSIGKGDMVNAVRYLGRFLAMLPTDRLAPEVTDGREGFLHPYHIEGGVAKASAQIILRDFEEENLAGQAELLQSIADQLQAEEPRLRIDVAIRRQYRNMRDGLKKEPRAVEKAVAAMKAAGLEPKLSVIRGGTDGSLMTEAGLPTPNLSCGGHNPHSPLEWASLDEMQMAVDVLIELAKLWAQEEGR